MLGCEAMARPKLNFMKANQNRRAWLWLLAISGLALPVRAQSATNEMVARAREWRLDGTIVGLDARRSMLRLQPDVLVMRAEGDAVALGEARETAMRLIATDDKTQMWTPDGQLRPLFFAALRNAAQIIVIGPLQSQGAETVLRARIVVLRQGLPADYRAPQVLAVPQTPPHFSTPQNQLQVLAPAAATSTTAPQVLAVPAAPHLSTPGARPQVLAPPQISAPRTPLQVLAPAPAPIPVAPPATVVLRPSPPPIPIAPPLVNRAPHNEDARRAATETMSEAPHSHAPDETRRAALSSEDWSRRVPPPTLSLAPHEINETNAPQVLAPPISTARAVTNENRAVENRLVTPPTIERAGPPQPARLSANFDWEDSTAPVTNFPRTEIVEDAPATNSLALRAVPPTSAPRDMRRPALSLDETPLRGRGALTSAVAPVIVAPSVADGRASLRLDDAQSLLQQQQIAVLARANYAQLRSAQNAIAWPTFSNGASDEKLVALTFDDGPHPTGTPAILEQLRRFGVPATFFVVGRNVENHPELLQREAAAGHDIANHSWHHFQGVPLSAEQWREEIVGTNRIIENLLGVAPRWFRAPGCHYSREALDALDDLQMVRADSSNNSGDWEGGDPTKTVARVLNRLAPGQVLLFHDSVPQTAQALPILLRELQARGYRCVTLTELAARAAQVPGFVPEFHPVGQGIVLPTNVAATR